MPPREVPAMAAIEPCAPPPGRCRTTLYPLSKPGISSRQIPTCAPDYCGLVACGSPNWRVTREGTLDRSHWVEGWIAQQLFQRGEVSCDEHPLKQRSGGWWADAFRIERFRSGSKLWALQWEPVTNDTLLKAKNYALEALQYLLAWGIVGKLTVDALYISRTVMQLRIMLTIPGAATTAPPVPATLVFQGEVVPAKGWLWKEDSRATATA